MNIRNGEPGLANRPWTHWTLIGASVVLTMIGGYSVGSALFGTPEPAQVAAEPPETTYRLRLPLTPTLLPTATPAAAATSVAVAPLAAQAAAGGSTPPAAAANTPLPTLPPQAIAPSNPTIQMIDSALQPPQTNSQSPAGAAATATEPPAQVAVAATATATPIPTSTATAMPPTATPVPPTATATNTLAPTATSTATPMPTNTATPVPPSATAANTAEPRAHQHRNASAAGAHGGSDCGVNCRTDATRDE